MKIKYVVIVSLFFFLTAWMNFSYAQTNTWTGAVNNDWHNPCNWSAGLVPVCIDNVIIPSVSNKPVISATACANTFNPQTGADLTILSLTLLQIGTCPCTPTITPGTTITTANAGIDQTVCSNTAILSGNIPIVGTGLWTLITGSGTISAPTSPTSGLIALGAGANTFRWTISYGSCLSSFDDVIITNSAAPTTAAAGSDQTICATTAVLAGNTPVTGTGTWTLVGGSGTITTPGSATSGLTALGVGANTFRWTISNPPCTASFDDVIITSSGTSTTAAAGSDQTICATTATLAGNTPGTGSGTWTLVGGSGTITTPGSSTSGLTALGVGANTFRWTISNPPCTASLDDVIITNNATPSISAAGSDQTICATTATLAGNTPGTGSGTWTLVGGSGTITTPGSSTSGLTALGVGANTFRWTISNPPCTASFDDVIITRSAAPTVAAAGANQNLACVTTATLAGNTPTIGTGVWSVVSGTATISSTSSPNSGITGLVPPGSVTLRWTISNSPCTASTSDVIITTAPCCSAVLSLCSWNGSTSFTDSRDSKAYSQTQIGTQCWMAQNLDYGTYVPVATGQGGGGTQKYCYGDNSANCTVYGGMYEWDEMMNGAASCNGTGAGQPACLTPVPGICPSGWHIPSHYEWTLLITT